MEGHDGFPGGGMYMPIGGGLEVEEPEHLLRDGRRPLLGRRESPSPADLFRGESSKFPKFADLDHFFERVYHYYCNKGFWCIVTQWLVELLTLGFTIMFSGFLLLFINWRGLLSAQCGITAAEEGHKPCDLVREGLYPHPLKPLSIFRVMAIVYLVIFSLYWLFCFVRFFTQLRETLEIRDFCHRCLGVSERELQTMSWPALVDRMVQIQRVHRLSIVKELSAHDIVSRIMRKENYLIGMLNKGVLGLPVPSWLPGAGPTFCHSDVPEEGGKRKHLVLTKTLEWSLSWCILHNMFDRNFLIRKDFVSNPRALQKRLMAVGLCMLVLSPFLTIFMLIYFFLRNAEQFYHQPSTAGSRRWSNLARWNFREFNELEHMFKHRLNASYKHAVEYVKQFPSPIISMIAKFVSFVTGAFAAVLLGIALVEESLLEAQLGGRNLFWYAAIFGTILAVSRSLIMEEYSIYDPEGVMQRVVYHTHFLPKHWRGAANTDIVRSELEALFQYKALLFVEEMVSIFVSPFILWLWMPACVEDIIRFVQDFTIDIEGVGHVCSLSMFDFEQHGNSNYASPFHTDKTRRSSQGKMEKSFVSFKSHYPTWEPSTTGKQFLANLADFRSRHEAADLAMSELQLASANPFASASAHRWAPPSRLSGVSTSESSPRGAARRIGSHGLPLPGGGDSYHGGGGASSSYLPSPDRDIGESSASYINPEQISQLYWLDRYYASRSQISTPHHPNPPPYNTTPTTRNPPQTHSSYRTTEIDNSQTTPPPRNGGGQPNPTPGAESLGPGSSWRSKGGGAHSGGRTSLGSSLWASSGLHSDSKLNRVTHSGPRNSAPPERPGSGRWWLRNNKSGGTAASSAYSMGRFGGVESVLENREEGREGEESEEEDQEREWVTKRLSSGRAQSLGVSGREAAGGGGGGGWGSPTFRGAPPGSPVPRRALPGSPGVHGARSPSFRGAGGSPAGAPGHGARSRGSVEQSVEMGVVREGLESSVVSNNSLGMVGALGGGSEGDEGEEESIGDEEPELPFGNVYREPEALRGGGGALLVPI